VNLRVLSGYFFITTGKVFTAEAVEKARRTAEKNYSTKQKNPDPSALLYP